MALDTVNISSFRNIESASVNLNCKLNFLLGNNGSGKTSFLESIFYLAHGKSFRTSQMVKLVCSSSDELVVNVKDNFGNRLGVSRNTDNGVVLKVNGQAKLKLSEVARLLAVQIITPESFKLFWGGPKERRKFVDLGLFHVEHNYGAKWQDFVRVLKQRNSLLKNGKKKGNLAGFDYWSEAFCKLSNELNDYRSEYVNCLINELSIWLSIFLPEFCEKITLKLYNGWSSNSSNNLVDILQKGFDRELKYGFSIAGAHKFDLLCQVDGEQIDNILSRGQQKLFLLALIFAQSNLIDAKTNSTPLILIDDIGAELDITARNRFAEGINKLSSQLFVTAIDEIAVEPIAKKATDYKMFHVEHGVITEN